MNKRDVGSWVLIVLFLIFLLVPIFYVISTSLKPPLEIIQRFTIFPQSLTFKNYTAFFTQSTAVAANLFDGYINSIIIGLSVVAICTSVGFLAAYAFSRGKFLADKHIFFWLLTNRMAPPAALILPYYIMYTSIGLYDSYIAVILCHTLFTLPLAVWIMNGFMSDIPEELDQAAFIDGYGTLRYFKKIFLPLMYPGIGVSAFLVFIFSWSEMLLGQTVTSSVAEPYTVATSSAVFQAGVDWGMVATSSVLSIIPGVILVILVRGYLARGFSMGRI